MGTIYPVTDGARLEAVLGASSDGNAVALWDVAHLLPVHPTKRYRMRTLDDIRQQYVHHSGALRKGDPFAQMLGSARYAIASHGWPGIAYHTWVPYHEVRDSENRRVVYRGNADEVRVYHAGPGPNERALAHCLQGNLTAGDMSEHQSEALPVLIQWCAINLAISPTAVFGHFQAPDDGHRKDSCPGRAGKAWVLGYRSGRDSRRLTS
jgi:hypothetical protein